MTRELGLGVSTDAFKEIKFIKLVTVVFEELVIC